MRIFTSRGLKQLLKPVVSAFGRRARRTLYKTAGCACAHDEALEAWPQAVPPGGPHRASRVPATRTWDDGYVVRLMRREEAPLIGQYYTDFGVVGRDDIEIGYEFASDEPGKGFYVGVYQDKIVCNLVYTEPVKGILYASDFYIPEHARGHSFGARLRSHVEPQLIGTDKILVVDAMPYMAKLLTSRVQDGWTIHWRTLRYQGRLPPTDSLPQGIYHGGEVPFEFIMEYDDRCFLRPGLESRRGFMERWTQLDGGATVVAFDAKNKVVGYAVRRPALQKNHHLVGPMYAENGRIAEKLLRGLAYQMNETAEYTLDSWERNSDAMALMAKYRFKELSRLYHMYQNGDPRDYNPRLFSVTSVDVCWY